MSRLLMEHLMPSLRALLLVVSVLQGLLVGACSENPKAGGEASETRLVVYSGRGAVLVQPLIDAFTKDTGIQVDVRFGKTEALANQLAVEGESSAADVFFAQEAGWLGLLAEKGQLQVLPAELLEQVPASARDAAGLWVGTSGRARVLVYDPSRVKAEDLPTRLEQLAGARWRGQLGWAPSNASFQAHVTALRHIWGEEKTRAWLKAMSGHEVAVYPKNSPQVRAVSNGEITVGWVNHYYLHKLKAANPELRAANHSFVKGDAGNLMMLAGVGITAHSQHGELAQRFVRYLLSESAQQYFAQKVFEYPTRPGVATHPDVPPLDDRTVTVPQEKLIDLKPTLTLLRELGLQ